LAEILKNAPANAKIYWVQEENFNGGAFQFVQNRINRVLDELSIKHEVKYVGRRAISAAAVGSSELHKKESAELAKWISSLIV
jgi:2-oxoglutarate dehydrogenase E1 component